MQRCMPCWSACGNGCRRQVIAIFAPARHVLLSLRHDRSPVRDPDGAPSLRLCNFELMQKAPGVRAPTACWARTPRARRALAAMTCTFYNPPTFSPRRLSAGSSRKNSLPPPAASIAESDRICTMAPTCSGRYLRLRDALRDLFRLEMSKRLAVEQDDRYCLTATLSVLCPGDTTWTF